MARLHVASSFVVLGRLSHDTYLSSLSSVLFKIYIFTFAYFSGGPILQLPLLFILPVLIFIILLIPRKCLPV